MGVFVSKELGNLDDSSLTIKSQMKFIEIIKELDSQDYSSLNHKKELDEIYSKYRGTTS